MQVIITAARVIVGPNGRTMSPGAVLVDGDTITAVGPPAAITELTRRDAVQLSYPDATVMPGLIDAHVHLAFTAGRDPLTALNSLDGEPLLDVMAGHAGQLLVAGVTTVRDLGDRGYLAARLRDRIAAGRLLGPRILTSGAPLTPREGHCWFLGGTVEGKDDVTDTITSHASHGVDWVKVMASGGNITPNSPPVWQSQFSDELLQHIVAEATKQGLPVAAHAHSTAATAAAAKAGVASIEHCRWLTGASYGDPHLSTDTAAAIADRGIIVTPTIGTNYGLNEERRPGFVEHQTRVLQWQDEHGIRIMSGTDVGVSSFELYAEHRYVKAYELAGFPNARIVDLLTCHTADGLGLGRTIGTLGHGYSADLLVLDGNPLEDLSALRRPLLVMAQGHYQLPPRTPHSGHPTEANRP